MVLELALGRAHGDGRIPRFVRDRAALATLAAPLVASMLVAVVASRDPQRASYTGWLVLWVLAVASVPLLAGARPRLPRIAALQVHQGEIAFVAALTMMAFFVRAIALDSLPEPFSGDEAAFALVGLDVMNGHLPNMFRSALQGAPNLYFFSVAATETLFGVGIVGARAGSVLAGVLAVVATYFFLRELFGRTAATCGGLFLAFYHFHIHFSRQTLPNVVDTVLMPLVLLFAFRAARDGKRLDYALTGLTLGLTLYGWASARLIPLELAALWGWYILMRRRLLPDMLTGLAVVVVTIVIAAAPLGWWWYHHPNEFNTRLNTAGIYHASADGPSWINAQRATGRSTFDIYKGQAEGTWDLVFRFSDPARDFYTSPMPLVQHWMLVPFVAGVLLAFVRVRQPRYALLLIMFAGPLATGGMMTVPPASSARVLGIIPAVAALVAIGAEGIAGLALFWRPRLAPALAIALVLAVSALSLKLYFRDYGYGHHFAGAVTTTAEGYSNEVRSVVPRGTTIYWIRTDTVNPDFPTLGFGLRDYPVRILDSQNNEIAFRNPNGLMPGAGRVAFVFAGAVLGEQGPRIELACPNGEGHNFAKPGAKTVEFRIYMVDPGSCPVIR